MNTYSAEFIQRRGHSFTAGKPRVRAKHNMPSSFMISPEAFEVFLREGERRSRIANTEKTAEVFTSVMKSFYFSLVGFIVCSSVKTVITRLDTGCVTGRVVAVQT